MMKRLGFLETKRTPRYSMRKFNVGMASVLLGVTIFGINFTNHSVKAAATTESVEKSKQPSTVVLPTAERTNTQKATSAATANNPTEAATTPQSSPETQDSASNNATANNSTEAATTSQSAPKTQGSADTDIKSSTAKSAAKLAFMNLMAAPGTDTGTNTGTDRNAAVTVGPNNINDQPAKENQELANKSNLTSSDNYSSNIYKDKDGNYYKIVTIYGNDYVYHAADIQATNGQTAADTKNNISISKEDLGNGKTRWTVVFFPNKGLQNVGSKLSGLVSAKFGIALTSDYQIVGNVDMEVINKPNQKYIYYKFEDGSNSSTNITVQNPPAEVDFSFNPNTDVDPKTGLINNSKTLPAYNNKYLQGSYYFTTANNAGIQNLWQTYFKDANEPNNAYDGSPYLGGDHAFHFSTFQIANETGVDGAKQEDPIIYDTLGNRFNSVANSKGVFSSDNFNQAMEFKSHGNASNPFIDRSQYSSYAISFTTQHTDSHEVELFPGPKNQQFSGISANIYSYQNGYKNRLSSLYGEQRALDAKGNTVEAKDIIPHWDEIKAANKAIDDALVNKKGEINSATNIDQATKDNLIKEATDAAGAAKNAIAQATTADAIKKAQDDGISNINNLNQGTDATKDNVQNSNSNGKVTNVDDQGNTTITYPDGSKSTISGDDYTYNDFYQVIIKANAVEVYTLPKGNLTKEKKLVHDTVLTVLETKKIDGQVWYRIGTNRWIMAATTIKVGELENFKLKRLSKKTKTTAIVWVNKLAIYNNVNGKMTKKHLTRGTKVRIYAIATTNDGEWYKIGKNKWIPAAGVHELTVEPL